MKRVIFVLPIAAAVLLTACTDFQRRPYRYTRVYPHQVAAREKALAQQSPLDSNETTKQSPPHDGVVNPVEAGANAALPQ